MRTGIVHTLEDEAAWERAKEVATNEYPEATGSNYWVIVTGLYRQMTDYGTQSPHLAHDPVWRLTR